MVNHNKGSTDEDFHGWRPSYFAIIMGTHHRDARGIVSKEETAAAIIITTAQRIDKKINENIQKRMVLIKIC